MSNKNEFTVDLTNEGLFSGLYNSIWLHDETLNDKLEELAKELKKRYKRDIKLDFFISFKKYLTKIAEAYINVFENDIPNSKWEIESTYSPREYNFDTDHIVLKWVNAPEDAEKRFNIYLKDIYEEYNRFNDYNPYGDFELYSIYDSHCGYEIIHELAQIHDWDDDQNIVIYDEQNQPIMQKFEVENVKQ